MQRNRTRLACRASHARRIKAAEALQMQCPLCLSLCQLHCLQTTHVLQLRLHAVLRCGLCMLLGIQGMLHVMISV